MSEPTYRHLTAYTVKGVRVLTLTDPQVRGDELADELRDDLLAATGDADRVVLDLRHVEYLSSVAFRPLLQLHKALKERQGRVVLCHLSEPVLDVLHLTRLISTSGTSRAPFEEQPDLAAAIASLVPLN
jgi:anti-anti-sigma factor